MTAVLVSQVKDHFFPSFFPLFSPLFSPLLTGKLPSSLCNVIRFFTILYLRKSFEKYFESERERELVLELLGGKGPEACHSFGMFLLPLFRASFLLCCFFFLSWVFFYFFSRFFPSIYFLYSFIFFPYSLFFIRLSFLFFRFLFFHSSSSCSSLSLHSLLSLIFSYDPTIVSLDQTPNITYAKSELCR